MRSNTLSLINSLLLIAGITGCTVESGTPSPTKERQTSGLSKNMKKEDRSYVSPSMKNDVEQDGDGKGRCRRGNDGRYGGNGTDSGRRRTTPRRYWASNLVGQRQVLRCGNQRTWRCPIRLCRQTTICCACTRCYQYHMFSPF